MRLRIRSLLHLALVYLGPAAAAVVLLTTPACSGDTGVGGDPDGTVDGGVLDGGEPDAGGADGAIEPAVALVDGPSDFDQGLIDPGVAVIRTYEMTSGFVCPDGLPARFRVITPVGDPAGLPAVLVLHGGTFDGVVGGVHVAAPFDKLTRSWAECKLDDFLGYARADCDDPEENGGAIAAALARAPAVAVYPMGCWGDLWHGTGYQDPADGFPRQGLSFALAALEWAEQAFATDAARRHAWGTSAGGHGIAELVKHGGDFGRYVADAPTDFLPPFIDQSSDPQALLEVAGRIFEGNPDVDHIGSYSLYHAISQEGAQPEILYVYSCNDVVLTEPDISQLAAEAIFTHYGPQDPACVVHARGPGETIDLAGHVFTNGLLAVAEAAASFLLEGTYPQACGTAFEPCP